MTDIQAAIGIHQLRRLDDEIVRRAHQSACYDDLLAGLPLEPPAPAARRARSAHHLYSVRVIDGIDRDALLVALRDRGIGTGVHYRGVHLHPYYRDRYSLDPNELPVASDISRRTLSLPIGPTVETADQVRVVDALADILRGPRRHHRPMT